MKLKEEYLENIAKLEKRLRELKKEVYQTTEMLEFYKRQVQYEEAIEYVYEKWKEPSE